MQEIRSQALNALQRGDFDVVIHLCKTLKDPTPQLIEYQAIAECHQGNLEESKKLFLDAIQKDPKNNDLLYNYSEVLSDLGEITACNKILDQILARDLCHQAAISKKKHLSTKNKKINSADTSKADTVNFTLDRSVDPLQAAFNSNEVDAAKENLKERERKIRKQKLYQRPLFPEIDINLLNEERLLAAEDALRAGFPQLALKLSSEATAFCVNLNSIYSIAGDAYIALKQYNYAHLCYLIAAQYGELDLQRQINLLSLANTISDHQLLESRKENLIQKLGKTSLMHETIEKIVSQSKPNQNVIFDIENGPKPSPPA